MDKKRSSGGCRRGAEKRGQEEGAGEVLKKEVKRKVQEEC